MTESAKNKKAKDASKMPARNHKQTDSVRSSVSNKVPGFDINPWPSHQNIELVFGLVGPTGVNSEQVSRSIANQLQSFNYKVIDIRLSDLIHRFTNTEFDPKSKFERINQLMNAGTLLREESQQPDIVGRLGLAQIRNKRKSISGDEKLPPPRGVAYIVRSFKRPEEVELFRSIYGKAFNLISIFSPRQARIDHLKQIFEAENGGKNDPTQEEKAIRLINRDFKENSKLGQKVSKTFPLADFFISNDSSKNTDEQISRLVKLIFGHPYVSPTKDEQGIFFAHAAALRSLDLSRQVGAAIVNTEGDIISTGCNEVPKFGGGMYWAEDENPNRDFEQGEDANVRIKFELTQDAISHLQHEGWLSDKIATKSTEELTHESLDGDQPFLRHAKLFDVIEFGRAVHGEMAAITQAAKLGIPLKGTSLYCTTFPCHLCARHIVSSGIREVIFIEPYEKSRTGELYRDSISIEPHEPIEKKAVFRSFVGVAPRRYMDFFSLAKERKNLDGTVLNNESIGKSPKISRPILTYLFLEDMFIHQTKRPNQPRKKNG